MDVNSGGSNVRTKRGAIAFRSFGPLRAGRRWCFPGTKTRRELRSGHGQTDLDDRRPNRAICRLACLQRPRRPVLSDWRISATSHPRHPARWLGECDRNCDRVANEQGCCVRSLTSGGRRLVSRGFRFGHCPLFCSSKWGISWQQRTGEQHASLVAAQGMVYFLNDKR